MILAWFPYWAKTDHNQLGVYIFTAQPNPSKPQCLRKHVKTAQSKTRILWAEVPCKGDSSSSYLFK